MSNNALIMTDRFELSDALCAAIEEEKHHYEDPRAASIEALKMVQKEHGWVPDGAIYAIAEVLGIPASDVEGVATFYSQIFRQPVGRNVVHLCDSMVCYIGGQENLAGALREKLGIDFGETTEDGRFTLLPTCCLGNCDKAPAMMINDDTFGDLTVESLLELLEQYQ